MAFIGSINSQVKKIFWNWAEKLNGETFYVGCSGNFSFEQIVTAKCPESHIYSNDISLYSSVIGHLLVGRRFRMEMKHSELQWINDYIQKGDFEGVAAILLLTSMLEFERRTNTYAERMWDTYLTNWPKLFEKTLSKVMSVFAKTKIREYTMMDVFDFYPRPGGISVAFMPTYEGGYERLFQRLDAAVDWDPPEYQVLTEARKDTTIENITSGDFILYDDVERDLPCVAMESQPGKRDVFIYSNIDFKKAVLIKRIPEKTQTYNLLMSDMELPPAGKISFIEADINTVNHYRNMYLSKKIIPGSGGPCLMFFIDDLLFGFIIFQTYSKKESSLEAIYMLSDFVVPSRKTRRLAKLLLICSKTREVNQFLNEKTIRRIKLIRTTAFTDKPISMKYRGVYELEKRGEGFLNYTAEFDQSNLEEAYQLWQKKHNKPSRN